MQANTFSDLNKLHIEVRESNLVSLYHEDNLVFSLTESERKLRHMKVSTSKKTSIHLVSYRLGLSHWIHLIRSISKKAKKTYWIHVSWQITRLGKTNSIIKQQPKVESLWKTYPTLKSTIYSAHKNINLCQQIMTNY